MCKTCMLNTEKCWWRKLKNFYINEKIYCAYGLKDDVKMSCMHAQSLQTLCDPVDCSPPGSSVHGILQTRVLEWITMPSSRGSFQPRDWTLLSYVSWTRQNTGVGAFPFSRGSSQPRDQTQVSSIAGGFFTSWTTSVAPRIGRRMLYH